MDQRVDQRKRTVSPPAASFHIGPGFIPDWLCGAPKRYQCRCERQVHAARGNNGADDSEKHALQSLFNVFMECALLARSKSISFFGCYVR